MSLLWKLSKDTLLYHHPNQGMFQLYNLVEITVFDGKIVAQGAEFPSRESSV